MSDRIYKPATRHFERNGLVHKIHFVKLDSGGVWGTAEPAFQAADFAMLGGTFARISPQHKCKILVEVSPGHHVLSWMLSLQGFREAFGISRKKAAHEVLAWIESVMGDDSEGHEPPAPVSPTPDTPSPMPKWDGKGSPFDQFSHETEEGKRWYFKDLAAFLEYTDPKPVLGRSKLSARAAGEDIACHFVDVRRVIPGGRWGTQTVDDVSLTRYGCYLVAMNGDPDKPNVAAAQAYFAIRTHQAEQQEKKAEEKANQFGYGSFSEMLDALRKENAANFGQVACALVEVETRAIENAKKTASAEARSVVQEIAKEEIRINDEALKAAQRNEYEIQELKERVEQAENVVGYNGESKMFLADFLDQQRIYVEDIAVCGQKLTARYEKEHGRQPIKEFNPRWKTSWPGNLRFVCLYEVTFLRKHLDLILACRKKKGGSDDSPKLFG